MLIWTKKLKKKHYNIVNNIFKKNYIYYSYGFNQISQKCIQTQTKQENN